ncbi:unnamed protein product [Paramecium octaurelia]|uniref:Uncharacterized protein n=1 Tax=Paramecium octaurelia TaxID=43137 RepID=A0A8S1VMQ4_PAROT|nr:unnamed protein product [Paramecium octaurelia]
MNEQQQKIFQTLFEIIKLVQSQKSKLLIFDGFGEVKSMEKKSKSQPLKSQ